MGSDSKSQVRVSKKSDFCPEYLGFRIENSCRVGICLGTIYRSQVGFLPGFWIFEYPSLGLSGYRKIYCDVGSKLGKN